MREVKSTERNRHELSLGVEKDKQIRRRSRSDAERGTVAKFKRKLSRDNPSTHCVLDTKVRDGGRRSGRDGQYS